jgi:hypothetical protein
MAASPSRPPIPRPTARPPSAPPAAPASVAPVAPVAPIAAIAPIAKAAPTAKVAPLANVARVAEFAPVTSIAKARPASTPRQVADVPKAYQSEPPLIRDRMPTLELADDDIVEAAPVRRSSAPPPPPVRKSSAPPPPPVSRVVLKGEADAEVPVVPPAPAVPTELRGSAPDPTDVLFDGMYELEFVETSWQAANVCASALAHALGARAVVIHSHDLASRELRAIGAHGPNANDLLGAAEPSDDDFVASAVICNGKPVVMRFDGELPRLAPQRLTTVGASRALVAVPALAWGRCVAMIEVVDPDDRFASRAADCAAYVAERLAAFLSARVAA